jgi:hypothetical protein
MKQCFSYFNLNHILSCQNLKLWETKWRCGSQRYECLQMSEVWFKDNRHLHKFSEPSNWVVLLLNECFPWVSLVSSKVHHFINCLCLQLHLLFYQALETEVFSNNSFTLLKPITFISQRFSVLPMTQKLLKMGLLIQKISYSCASSELKEKDKFLTHH